MFFLYIAAVVFSSFISATVALREKFVWDVRLQEFPLSNVCVILVC